MNEKIPNLYEGLSYVRNHVNWGAEPMPPTPEGNFYDLIKQSVYRFPLKSALISCDRKISYSEMDEMSDRFATALADLGVKKGDRICVMLPVSAQTIIAFHAVIKVGAISVPVNTMFKADELTYVLNDSGAQIIIFLDAFYPFIKKVKGSTGLRHIISVHLADISEPESWVPSTMNPENTRLPDAIDFMSCINDYPAYPPTVSINSKEDIALVIYTAGTSGPPKGVMITHFNMAHANLSHCHTVGICHNDVNLQMLPMFHIGGYYLFLHPTLYKGGTVALLPMFEPTQYLKTLDKYEVNTILGIPTMFIALLNHPELSKYDLRRLRVCIAAGAPVPAEVQKVWTEKTGVELTQGWGMTECNAGAIVNIPNKKNISSIGVPITGEVKIVDQDTREILPLGKTGEMMYRSPQVAKGYWNKPEETKEAFQTDGWLRTGDAGYINEEGFIFFVDRIKDLIIASGYNISPYDVESAIMKHPSVMEVAVIGMHDGYRGESVKAYIVLKEGFRKNVKPEDIIGYCKKNMATYKVPRSIEFIDTLPKNSVGKVLRRELRRLEQEKLA
ncbi:MAG: class I adenylate-forming enzyme family protein [Syntrophobacteraceae bacterium]